MAKDGTNRGGARPGAGRKKKDAADRVLEGKTPPILTFGDMPEPGDMPDPEDMPKVDEWLKEKQHDGNPWKAEELTHRTVKWLRERNCDTLIPIDQIYTYAVAMARWIQCQRAISQYGFLSKHPTTGAPIESPFVRMSREFFKQANSAWFSIFQVVKDNCTEAYSGTNPHEQAMAEFLSD